ncbi:MAG: peptidase M64 N-terminal domain-containing protein, partial [Ignavibacteriaceae bacterium]
MKKLFELFFCSLFVITSVMAQQFATFDKYFNDKTMRIDYFHTGNAESELVTLDQIYQYGIWAGSRKHLMDEFNYGRYFVKVYDATSNELIFSRGFDSYFGEYQTSEDAINGIKKTYHESALIPSPKGKIIFVLVKRDKENKLGEIFRREIDPENVDIRRDDLSDPSVGVFG